MPPAAGLTMTITRAEEMAVGEGSWGGGREVPI